MKAFIVKSETALILVIKAYQGNIGLHLPTLHVSVVYNYWGEAFLKSFFC